MSTPKVVGIIGEGKMGTNLFYYLLDFDLELKWLVSPDADSDKLNSVFHKKLQRFRDLCIMDEAVYTVKSGFTISADQQSLADCDMVIETIPENRELKKRLFTDLDPILKPSCILVSNSSSIKPSDIIPSAARKSCTIGIHFFYPVKIKNIIEIIITGETSNETLSSATGFAEQINRFYLVQNENSGFILNRIYLEFQLEAWKIVEEGLMSIPAVDSVIRENIFPVGVFDFFDSVGIDVIVPSIKNYIRDYSEQSRFDSLLIKMESMLANGEYGMKSNSGFYQYPRIADDKETRGISIDKDIVINRLRASIVQAVEDLHQDNNYTAGELVQGLKEYLGVPEFELF